MAKSKETASVIVQNADQVAMVCYVGYANKSQDTAPKYCDKCGKCVTDLKTGISFVGIRFDLTIGDWHGLSGKFLRKQLGVFMPPDQNHVEYDVCWECWMKSFGIRSKGQ